MLDAVLAHAELVPLGDELRDRAVDIVGTGGDRSHSINVSTMAALVTAGAGVPVCKHGARGASSQCGTADVLEALGVAIELTPAAVRRCVDGGRVRLLLRAPVPSGVPLRRPVAQGDRHPDGVQPARPDGQPGAGPPSADRRGRRRLRRPHAGVGARPRLDRRLDRARRRPRRADHDRPLDGAGAAPRRRRRDVHRRPRRARAGAGDDGVARRRPPAAQRRGRAAGARRRATARTATSSCSTPPPRSWSPAWSPTCRPALEAAAASIDDGRAAAVLDLRRRRVPAEPPRSEPRT